ncbi:hypothetical protein RUND412_000280 [Rhizina undulata]
MSLPDLSALHIAPQPHYTPPPEQVRHQSRHSPPMTLRIPKRCPPPGYKPPSVESVPNSPGVQSTLSPDSKVLFEENPDYIPCLPAEEPLPEKPARSKKSSARLSRKLTRSDSWKHKPLTLYEEPEKPPVMERERKPYCASPKPPSTPPEASPREPRPYAISPPSPAPPSVASSRESRPYSMRAESPPPRESKLSSVKSESPPPKESRPYAIRAESPPPKKSPTAPRESRPYAMKTDSPIAMEREPKTYCHSPSQSKSNFPPPLPPKSQPQSQPQPQAQSQPQTQSHQPQPQPQPQFQPQPPHQPQPKVQSPVQLVQSRPNFGQPSSPKLPPPQQQQPTTPTRQPSPPKRVNSLDIAQLPACPQKKPAAWGQWYQHNSIQDFNICIRCYYTHIRPTPLHVHFRQSQPPPPEYLRTGPIEIYCDFWTPRILELVWPKAVDLNNIKVLVDYARYRCTITRCCAKTPGRTQLVGLNSKWYKTYDGSIPNFLVCEACYEDIIVTTAFPRNFVPTTSPPRPDSPWVCDLTIPFILGGLQELSRHEFSTDMDQWPAFLKIARFRLDNVPPCPGAVPIKAPGRKWWTTKVQIPGLWICDACYCDQIVPSSFKPEFIDERQDISDPAWVCSMATFPVRLSFSSAVEKNLFQVFLDGSRSFHALKPCTFAGVTDGELYTLAEHLENFQICKTCFHTLVRPLGLGTHFQPVRYPGTTKLCDLWVENPRHHATIQKLIEASDWKDFEIFRSWITPRSEFPPCAPRKLVTGVNWYEFQNGLFVVCEECWYEYVRESPLAFYLPSQPRYVEEPQACDLYSNRMKKIWKEACRTRNIEYFIDAAQERARVYKDVMPTLFKLNSLLETRMNAQHSMYESAALMDSMGGGGQVMRYGRPSESEKLRKEAGDVGKTNADIARQIAALEAMWGAVE